ncbi:hypothetical protein DFJ63DRAFT_285471 [Scheffersomyces coipomensis]|uniref:uncharacterized protein n=1 Tax=Scheffersomyces coipomensis TaxID=1788519 RepID=UPI00315DC1EC
MSFAFGFTQDDFSDDDELINNGIASQQGTAPTTTANSTSTTTALDKLSETIDQKNLPKTHSLDSILQTLVDVRLSFDQYITPRGGNIVYRRELFDVKHQIMTEDHQQDHANGGEIIVNDILIDENSSDLQKNVYEGGFKSWECSYDSIDKINQLITNEDLLNKFDSYLDLGCGTSLPSSFLFSQLITNGTQLQNKHKKTIILSDFNYDVLRLVSLPNLIIQWAVTNSNETLISSEEGEKQLLITESLINQFKSDLLNFDIELVFVSGSWGKQFNQVIKPYNIDFIVSSETIYSLDTLPIVAETLIELLQYQETTNIIKHRQSLIAAKNIYFGVGGSVIEFMNYLQNLIHNDKHNTISTNTEEINESQLRRSIIMITNRID